MSAALRPVVALQRRAGSPWPAGDAELVRRWQAWETQEAIAEAMDLPVHQVRERVRRLRAHGVALRTGKTTKPGSRWDDAADQRLRSLWDDGHSTEEIARRMGTTKNSVVGRAHRLDLLGRPSPIRRSGEPRSEHRRPGRPPVPRATLPPLASQAPVAAPSTDHGWRVEPLHQEPGAGRLDTAGSPVAPRAPAPGSGHSATSATKGAAPATGGMTTGRVVTPPAAPRPPPAAAAPHRVPVQHVREVAPPALYGRVEPCAWPLDDWRRPGRFVSCDAPSLPGRPYCGEHCERAYQRAPARREDAHA